MDYYINLGRYKYFCGETCEKGTLKNWLLKNNNARKTTNCHEHCSKFAGEYLQGGRHNIFKIKSGEYKN